MEGMEPFFRSRNGYTGQLLLFWWSEWIFQPLNVMKGVV